MARTPICAVGGHDYRQDLRPRQGIVPLTLRLGLRLIDLVRSRDFGRSVLSAAPLKRSDGILKRRPNALDGGGVDGPGIEVEIEAGHVFAEDLNLPPRFIKHPLHDIGNHRSANALYRDLWQRACRYNVAHENVGVVADDYMSRLGDRLETRREINLGTDGGIVHAVSAAEVADVAEAGVDAHAHAGTAVLSPRYAI